MPRRPRNSADSDAQWRTILIEGHRRLQFAHAIFRHLPSAPRCKVCHNPFEGVGGRLLRLWGYSRSRKNPTLCMRCCEMLPPGGAEVDIAVLFADVRGSTGLAERIDPSAYAGLMNRFYNTATEVLVRHDAIIDKMVGDEVMALFIPGICGPAYKRRAVEAALALLAAVAGESREGMKLPIGAGVSSGIAYVGNVGGGGVVDFTALGDTVNTAARLASSAGAGEVLVSESVTAATAGDHAASEFRTLTLRGKETPVTVGVLRPG